MSNLELKDLPQDTVNNTKLIGVDNAGNAKKVDLNTELNKRRNKVDLKTLDALVNFDGYDATIRNSFNIKSVVRISQGVYEVYFTKNMERKGYVVSGSVGYNDGGKNISLRGFYISNQEVNKCKICVVYANHAEGGYSDYRNVNLMFGGGS